MLKANQEQQFALTFVPARTAAFRVRGEEETPIYTNRADENGLISGMPCPSVARETTVDVEVGEQTIRVTTV